MITLDTPPAIILPDHYHAKRPAIIRPGADLADSFPKLQAAIPFGIFAGYKATGAQFDGADWMKRGGDLTSIASSKKATFSFWIKPETNGTTRNLFNAVQNPTGSDGRTRAIISSLNRFAFTVHNSGGTTVLSIRTSDGSVTNDGAWHHVILSVDLTSTSLRHMYLDDVSNLTVDTYTNDNMSFAHGEWAVGAKPDELFTYTGGMAELFWYPDLYVDLSVTANRRKFRSATGKPVDPDAPGGIIATYGTPVVRLTGNLADWHNNKGSGGGFNLTGTLTQTSIAP